MNISGSQQKKTIGVSLKLVSVYFYENVFLGSSADSYNKGHLYEKQHRSHMLQDYWRKHTDGHAEVIKNKYPLSGLNFMF